MRALIINCLIILSMAPSHAQNNLILNGSFEDVNGCPWVNLGAINEEFVSFISNPAKYTPDYYNTCYTVLGFPYNGMGVPSNARGYQLARTGDAFIGIDLWEKNHPAREYTQIKFIDTLKQGHHYYFTCYLNMANKFRYATANFGAYFSIDSVSMPALDVLPFVPQIENPDTNILTDTLNWMSITGTYLANGGEKFILLGNFKPVSAGFDTAYQYYGSPNHANWAYYYIDDVSLIDLDSTLAVNENEALAQVQVFPNPANSTIMLNNTTGFKTMLIEDMKGSIVFQTQLNANTSAELFDVSNLANGIYIVKLKGFELTQQLKLIVNK